MQEWRHLNRIALAAALVWVLPFYAEAGTSGAVYDMRALLSQSHPFHPRPQAAAPSAVPRAAVPRSTAPSSNVVMPVAPVAPVRPASGGLAPASTRTMPRPVSVVQDASRPRGWHILSEVRTGVLAHDQGAFSSHKEKGVDVNFEVLFISPDFLKLIWSPRPHIGLNANSSGDTSQAYLGLSWEWDFWRDWFAGFSFGGAVHDGETKTTDVTRKELGCTVLFRESLEFGYRLTPKHALSLFVDHISNAKLCDTNEGLENVGLRYGYRF